MWRAIKAIIGRDLKRMLRQRGRLVSSLVRPLMWLFVIGSGYQALLSGAGDYRQFLVPGLLAMVLLFGALLPALSIVYDQESGVMRMLIVAPFPRYIIILARTLSASLIGLIQAALFLMVLAALGYVSLAEPLHFILGLLLTAAACASTGSLVAVFSKGLEDFAVIMNFVIFPMFFLSGALYPVNELPLALKLLASANPVSYGVDLLKHGMLGGGSAGFRPDFSVLRDLLALTGYITAGLTAACIRFSQAPVLESLARILGGSRRT
ncbi:MAG: ABC transporter permease [Gammaproteobacteria bacterium]